MFETAVKWLNEYDDFKDNKMKMEESEFSNLETVTYNSILNDYISSKLDYKELKLLGELYDFGFDRVINSEYESVLRKIEKYRFNKINSDDFLSDEDLDLIVESIEYLKRNTIDLKRELYYTKK